MDAYADEPYLLLPEHYRQMETCFRDLLASTSEDDPVDRIQAYRSFQAQVLDHLAVEEEAILPYYEEREPAEAARVRDAHHTMRELLYRVGTKVERYGLDIRDVRQLVHALREQSFREESTMYPWAEANLSPATKREIYDRIEGALRSHAPHRSEDRYAAGHSG